MKRLALIEPVGGHGGMAPYDLGICRGLVEAGWRVSWYTCPETVSPNEVGVDFCPVYVGIWGSASRWLRALRYLRGSLKALHLAVRSHERVCHLHFFNGAPEELTLLILCRVYGRKVVLTVHDVESFAGSTGFRSRLAMGLYGLAHRLVVHNRTSLEELSKRLSVPATRLTVIPHGNYLHDLGVVPSRQAAKKALRLPATSKVALFFGQIKSVKGLDLLLEAFAIAAKMSPDFVLVIAGRPWKTDFSSLARTIDEFGIGSRCMLNIRYIPDDEVATFYACAELVVLPYRRIYQSGVLLLAMSYERAVLVSDLPGMTDIVTDFDNGFVFQTGSVASLAERLEKVLTNDELRDRTALNGYQYVLNQHNWSTIAKQLAELYGTLE